MAVFEPGKSYAPNTVADDLHHRLRARICEGDFMPGETLSIRRLSQEYGTSVIPARDAIRSLVAEGALEFADSRKIIVPVLSNDRFQDILFARKTLEGEAAYRAFPNLTGEDCQKLREIDRCVDRAIRDNDPALYMKNNYRFHFAIYRSSNSPIMFHLIEILWLQYGPNMRFICARWGASSMAQDYHRVATDALERGDRDGFRAAIEADIEQGMGIILDG
jgi:DNA-binding GntR family transcriptional regulator